MNEQKIIINCGPKPENVEFVKIQNDPNFVFTNDPNFNTLVLYDQEGNIVNVNSWLECAQYVDGDWSKELLSITNYEQQIFAFLALFLVGYISYKIRLRKIND